MPNLTPFEIALLILGAVLIAALAAILWWHLAGDRVKALINSQGECSHAFQLRHLPKNNGAIENSEDELEVWCVSVKEMLKSGDHKTDARILEQINCVCDYYSSDIRKVPFKGSGRRFITLQEKIKLIREKINPLF